MKYVVPGTRGCGNVMMASFDGPLFLRTAPRPVKCSVAPGPAFFGCAHPRCHTNGPAPTDRRPTPLIDRMLLRTRVTPWLVGASLVALVLWLSTATT